jgi:cyclopropane fatty-acyl-phospholipid synthase-like methyltransferase
MKVSIPLSDAISTGTDSPPSKKQLIINYYEKAGRDYYTWSKQYNMHFGYFEKGMNPFVREAMLEKLNENVLQRLKINISSFATIADFGCGLGATLRYGVKKFPNSKFKGITLVPWQVEQAKALIAADADLTPGTIEIIEGDYCNTPFAANSLDGVVAIESSCYATGDNKSDLLKEIHRVLKPGGRFTISDGFIKKPMPESGILREVYRKLCHSWALTELGNIQDVHRHLKHLNFHDLCIEEISLSVAPSVAHVPFTVIYFLLKEFFFGNEPLSKERWDNLKSPLLTMVLGSARSYFGYYFISGTKSK